MVYFILGILILLFYLFMTPKSIRGTLDSVVLVILIVSIIVLTCLAVFQIFQLPSEFFVGALLAFVGYLALVDISRLPTELKKRKQQKLNINRQSYKREILLFCNSFFFGMSQKVLQTMKKEHSRNSHIKIQRLVRWKLITLLQLLLYLEQVLLQVL